MIRRSAAALLLAALLAPGCGGDADPPLRAARGAPNVVVVITDDQDAASLGVMETVRGRLQPRGVRFRKAYASYPLCCPSRVTFLTGQYAHNHGAKGNFPDTDGGGYVSLVQPERTLPAWLREAGYRTGHVGKWPSAPGAEVPPGWDRWLVTTPETSARYYDFALVNGSSGEPREARNKLRYGRRASDYHTDVVTDLAAGLIDHWGPGRRPFFLSVAYLAPHVGAGRDDAAGDRCAGGAPVPAPRHAGAYGRAQLPRPPSFDEADVSDKPAAIAKRPLSGADVDELERDHRCRLAALLAVDEGVGRILDALEAVGELERTVVVLTSDNGYLLGEHRFAAQKNAPYEEALRVPLVIAGPGVSSGEVAPNPVANVDLAPTILELTGVRPPEELARPLDGRSLVAPAGGRGADRALLVEGRYDTAGSGDEHRVVSYVGVRTDRYLYVEHREATVASAEEGAASALGAGERIAAQLYDTRRDPFQLENRASDGRYRRVRGALVALLGELDGCEGDACLVEPRVPAPVPDDV